MALPNTRPTVRRCVMPAMPVTMVRKITGAMTIFTSLMKASPSGLNCAPYLRLEMPQQHAQHNGQHHLEIQLAVKRQALGRGGVLQGNGVHGGSFVGQKMTRSHGASLGLDWTSPAFFCR